MGENIFKSISDEDRELLESLLDTPEEEVDNALEKAHSILRGLIGRKSVDETELEKEPENEEVEDEEELPEGGYEALRDKIFHDLNVDGLQEIFKNVNTHLGNLSNRIQELEGSLAEVQQEEDEKVASKFEFPNWKMLFNQPEEENETIVERLKENLPETEENTEPSVLDIGFYQPFFNKK
jgi:hypothetical protein